MALTHAQQVAAAKTLMLLGPNPKTFAVAAGGGSITSMATTIATKFAGTALVQAIWTNVLKWKVAQDRAQLTVVQAAVTALDADITANTPTG